MDPQLRRALLRLALQLNARSPRIRSRTLTIPSFFAGWISTEAAAPLAAVRAVGLARSVRRGALATTQGRVATAVDALALAGGAKLVWDARRADEEFEAALLPHVGADHLAGKARTVRAGAALPVLNGQRRRIRQRNVAYHDEAGWRNTMDIYEPVGPTREVLRPAIVEIHGGGWILGDKNQQGVPLLHHMVKNGWVGFNINYRLAPKAKFPEQLIDCKRAIAWIRRNAVDLGVDPDFICVTGGSAGGHLSSLVALSENDTAFQPGFESADTSIAAAVPFYGVYDLLDESSFMAPGFTDFLERVVVGSKLAGDEDRWRQWSPIHRIHTDAPPMMMIHGNVDTLVPVEQGRAFAARLNEVSEHAAIYVELAGANHAFDVFPSVRSLRTVEYVERFLSAVRNGTIK